MARDFAEVLKAETAPGQLSDPSTYAYGPQGARRARTFSQVIAEATRGMDAGMNRFSGSPNGSPMGLTDAQNQAPDWRGHYLGADGLAKRDFEAVLADVREAIDKASLPGVPHPHAGNRSGGRRITTNPKDAQPLRSTRLPRATGWAHKGDFDIGLTISKVDDDENLVFGWASIIEEDGVPCVDTQGDVISEDDLEDAFYHFATKGREADEMHTDEVKGEMVECCVFTKEKQRALGINLGKVGAWVGFRVDPDTFQKVKSGELPAFSIGGFGRRVPIED